MMQTFRNFLLDPRVRGIEVDDNDLLDVHRRLLSEKRLLRSAFETFYSNMIEAADRHCSPGGIELELGTGAGFMKSLRPGLTTSDVRTADNIDMRVDALDMPFADGSVRCVYAINVFHHLSDVERFFVELKRVLKVGGAALLIEPHGGFASATVHRYLHSDETYDKTQRDWRLDSVRGPLSGANQALAHIVFERDRPKFEARYGGALEIVEQSYQLNAMRYLVSGGVNFRQLLPDFTAPLLSAVESAISPLARHWTLHRLTVIRKK
ncbi:class I SAM-dependent methyltransferase [Pseudomarimonas salicorniae]|uniref:Class I SAM-dependent methyltransferase n=1 Tax=Pseudomarimonas salicorniae TaxID=2933270 RepID=A0ABT0GIT8_9GAMM|nr:class I SAM-dependent methyltransferase [Lysobacter sp. CAU 1642]MCK7594469.1 class I SAM-dependent methyltransferase [Lysobacter sp. CAU 1642]